jgi:hypothetical protein
VGKAGKRRKIHHFPNESKEIVNPSATHSPSENWRRRLAALVAATGRTEKLAMKVLRQNDGGLNE